MPTLLVIGNFLSSFVLWVYDSIDKAELFIWSLVGYIIVIFGSLVYNEIIILHFCKFDFDTKEMINKRSLKETEKCQELFYSIVEDELENTREEINTSIQIEMQDITDV